MVVPVRRCHSSCPRLLRQRHSKAPSCRRRRQCSGPHHRQWPSFSWRRRRQGSPPLDPRHASACCRTSSCWVGRHLAACRQRSPAAQARRRLRPPRHQLPQVARGRRSARLDSTLGLAPAWTPVRQRPAPSQQLAGPLLAHTPSGQQAWQQWTHRQEGGRRLLRPAWWLLLRQHWAARSSHLPRNAGWMSLATLP